MRWGRIKTGLALVGACAALSILLPPLAGLLNVLGSLTLLALGGYSAYRAWAFMEGVVEASRRPATVRRNIGRDQEKDRSDKERPPSRRRGPRLVELMSEEPEERSLRLPTPIGAARRSLAEGSRTVPGAIARPDPVRGPPERLLRSRSGGRQDSTQGLLPRGG